jgi:sugar O-acyltransferase (sialic acid O-acetyltransferase NeuD family)
MRKNGKPRKMLCLEDNMAGKKLVLYGASGFGKEVAQIVRGNNFKFPDTYELLGFIDDGSNFDKGDVIGGLPWLGRRDWIYEHINEGIFYNCTIAAPGVKSRIMEELMRDGFCFETLRQANVNIPDSTVLGPGCVLYRDVSVSVDCTIGAGVLLNTGVTVGHDCVVGDYCSIMPGTGISGGCTIGSRVNIGGHAFVVPGRKIGDGATVAAGSIVFTNVRAGTTVLGNPAKRIKALEND